MCSCGGPSGNHLLAGKSAKYSSRSFLRAPRRLVGEALGHGGPTRIFPKHEIGAAGGDEEGRITVRL